MVPKMGQLVKQTGLNPRQTSCDLFRISFFVYIFEPKEKTSKGIIVYRKHNKSSYKSLINSSEFDALSVPKEELRNCEYGSMEEFALQTGHLKESEISVPQVSCSYHWEREIFIS